jgi:GNAT superfamily N-acetyltransferase
LRQEQGDRATSVAPAVVTVGRVPPLHLAQVNIGTLRAPIGDELIDDFREALDPVNAAGEGAPGFVWRLQDDSGNATSIQIFDNPMQLLNLTVWESIESLRAFAYRGVHRDFLRRRAEWFEPDGSSTALWWIPAEALPTEHEAARRVAFIERFGDSPYAFRMGKHYPQVVVLRAELSSPEAQTLIGALNAELLARYPEPGSTHFTLTEEQVTPGRGGFFIAWVDGTPRGCGAYRIEGGATAEIKRMYVSPEARGLKLGAAILDTLEWAAICGGATQLALETGVRQHEALGLYARAGFTSVPCWGDYALAPTSLCLGKRVC